MTNPAKVEFLSSLKSRKNIVHYLVFKRDEAKAVIDRRKVKALVATAFLAAGTYSVVQDPEKEKFENVKVMANLVIDSIDVPAISKPDKFKIKPKKKSQEVLPGLSLLKRSEKVSETLQSIKMEATMLGYSTDGPVRAKIDKFYDIGLQIEKGTVLLGKASTQNERLHINFSKAVTPSGETIEVSGKAVDPEDQGFGINGSAAWSKVLRLLGKVGLDFTSGLADGLKETEETPSGQMAEKSSLKNALLNGTSRATMEAAREYMQGIRSSPEQVSLPAGTIIHITIQEIN